MRGRLGCSPNETGFEASPSRKRRATDRTREAAESAIAGEERLFQARREGREGQRAQLRERIAQIGEEIRGLTAQQQSKDSEIKYIGEQLVGVSELYKKNLVTSERYVQLQRDQARLQGERGQLIADIARSRGKIAETELQILQLDQDFRTDVLKDLRETQAKIAELQERANAAADELKRTDIRAPQAGIVYQLQVHTIGGVIGKGDTVMQIAPRADALIVEAKVAPQDIDQVAVGASVRVRIGAGNRRTTPDLEGKVTVVSPDLTRESEATPKGIAKPAILHSARGSLRRRSQFHRRSAIGAGHAGRGLHSDPRSHAARLSAQAAARADRAHLSGAVSRRDAVYGALSIANVRDGTFIVNDRPDLIPPAVRPCVGRRNMCSRPRRGSSGALKSRHYAIGRCWNNDRLRPACALRRARQVRNWHQA